MQYLKIRGSEEPCGEYWGDCTTFDEIDDQLAVIRTLQIYDNGNILAYDQEHWSDEYGMLPDREAEFLLDASLLPSEYTYEIISIEEFEKEWLAHRPMNR